MNLPPLPEPCTLKVFERTFDYYTEAQMLALRAATVEACAKVCEWHALNGATSWREPRQDCADAIRGMKK